MTSGRRIPMFFNAKDMGASLAEVASDVIVTESQNILSRWFHSHQDVDLYIWCDQQKNVIKQQVSVCGQIVEWNLVEGVKTGFVLEEEVKIGMSGSEIIHFDDLPQIASLRMAVDLIRHTIVLNDIERQTLLNNFRNSPNIKKMDPNEVLALFSRPAFVPPRRTSWWSRLKKLWTR